MTVDHAYLVEMVKAIKEFDDRVKGYFEEYPGHRPAAGSKADAEFQSFADPECVFTAWGLAQLLLEFTSDHVSLFVKSLNQPVEVAGSITCVRSMMECSSLAAWFLDPSINVTERIQRTFAHRFEGLIQQLKLARSTGKSSLEIQNSEDRIVELEREAIQLGYSCARNKQQKLIWIGQPMPSATDLIQTVLGDGSIYKLLSAVAHGHHWATSQLLFEQQSDWDQNGVKGKRLVKAVKPELFAMLGFRVMKCLSRPLWNQCQYFGWNTLKLEEMLEDTADQMLISQNVRFWRT